MATIAAQKPDRAVGEEFGGDARPDHFDAPIGDAVAKRVAHLLHRRLLRLVAAGLLGNADQHVVGRAELLQLKFAEMQRADGRAHLGKIGRPGFGLHLDQRAADKIDAEIQPVEEVQQDCRDRQHRRNGKADAPEAHEVKSRVIGNDAKEAHWIAFKKDRLDFGMIVSEKRVSSLRSAPCAAATSAPNRP